MAFLRRPLGWYLLLALGAFPGVGCGNPGEKLIGVAGKVTVDGQPLKTGSVSFRPDEESGNKSAHQPTGTIEADGSYELFVTAGRKGAPPGAYRVVVIAYDNPQPGKPLKSFIDRQYVDEKTTPLRIEVIEKPELGRYDLKLTK
jgi:hypothetical protein